MGQRLSASPSRGCGAMQCIQAGASVRPGQAFIRHHALAGAIGLACAAWAALLPGDAAAADPRWEQCRAIADDRSRLACYDAMGSDEPAKKAALATFGLSPKTSTEVPEAIESTLSDAIDGWTPGTRIRLANGQVWQVADDSTGFLRANTRKVRVRRGALGSFHMEFEGTNRSPRVVRIN